MTLGTLQQSAINRTVCCSCAINPSPQLKEDEYYQLVTLLFFLSDPHIRCYGLEIAHGSDFLIASGLTMLYVLEEVGVWDCQSMQHLCRGSYHSSIFNAFMLYLCPAVKTVDRSFEGLLTTPSNRTEFMKLVKL